jgi:putative endonuclease
MPHFTYILYSAALDRFYIGSTSMAVEERLVKHLSNHGGFTSRTKDWVIFHREEFDSIQEAMAREKVIKSWKSKVAIKKLAGK